MWVDPGDGREVPCRLRGRLKKRQERVTSLVVVGDEVTVTLLPDGSGVVEELHPRRTELARPGFHGYAHVIAANVDQLVCVHSARQPDFKRRLVERYLTLARRAGAGALVVVSKCDLEREAVVRSWTAPLASTGCEVLLTSAVDGRGLDELRRRLAGRMSVFAGHSGVGKSTLVKALFPGLELATREVDPKTGKGRHSTSSSRLFRLPEGGYLIDTPGVRELGLFEDKGRDKDVAGVFPEIEETASACRFRDCSHTVEPGCAVRAAVEAGVIDADRYRSYLKLQRRGRKKGF